MHHEEIGKNPERISKLKPYVEQYDWSGIKFPTSSNQWIKFKKQNPRVALNVLYVDGEKQIKQAYISKHNSTRGEIADLLIVQEGDKKHYVTIKRLSALLRGIASSNRGDHYCRNCLNSFRTEKVCKDHVEVCKDHDYCHVKMPVGSKKWLSY